MPNSTDWSPETKNSTNWADPAKNSTNWATPTNNSTNWDTGNGSPGQLLLQTGDYLLMQNGSDFLAL